MKFDDEICKGINCPECSFNKGEDGCLLAKRLDEIEITPEPCMRQKGGKMDTIYRQAAIDAVSRGCQEFRGIFAECEKNLNELPSAQPEIIRCRDCKHSEHWYKRRCFLWAENGIDVFDDGFCNYAERRQDG